MKKVRLIVNLEPEKIARVKKYAKDKGLSVSKLVENHILEITKSDSANNNTY